MAQTGSTLTRRVRMLKHRYASVGTGVALVACLGMVVVVLAVTMSMASVGGVVIERDGTGEEGRDALPEPAAGKGDDGGGSTRVLVHVDGAVASPGVYEIEGEAPRVNDAVTRAGGLAADADTSQMNLAAPVNDGEKIHVPHAGEVAPGAPNATDAQGGQVATGAINSTDTLVNINTASESDLQRLTGVGEATAAAIVQDRMNNGPFSSTEDLMRVSGIGEKKFEKLRDQICV